MTDRFGPPRGYPRSIPWPPPPIERTGVMPSMVTLPDRANAVRFDPEEIRETSVMLTEAESGAGVALDGTFDTENKARTNGKKMADAIELRYSIKPRIHVIHEGSGATKRYRPALSLKSEDFDSMADAIEEDDAKLAAEAEAKAKAAAEAAEAAKAEAAKSRGSKAAAAA